MKWKPEEVDIIDYLYGSMTGERKQKFEIFLSENPDFQKEFDDLRLTQKFLPTFPDEEVIPPVPFEGTNSRSSKSWRTWLYPVSIAASITLILLTGYFTNFRMSFNSSGFEIGFVTPMINEPSLSQEQVNEMINKKVEEYAMNVEGKLVSYKTEIQAQIEDNQAISKEEINKLARIKGNSQLEDAQVMAFINQLHDENRRMMQNFYKVSADEQQTYMRNILLEFSDYLEKQRQQDLDYIQANFLDMRSSTELQQEETEKILANIITTVNNRNSSNNDRLSLD